ncbi:multiubiquitin domain-containing protein [Hydrogenophaga sp.]|uniref:multiubiquitin domain-containing protein n=1 Tax=Hydrogenophaga sp. TaxID=1904254 RepID=UPI003F706B6B
MADEQLNERHLDLSDPVPTGRQILQASGVRPVADYSIYAIRPSGEFEDLRLDETYDLRERGAERFVIFQTDRAFKFTIDDRQMEWGKPSISGNILKALAGVPTDTYDVYLEVRGGGQDVLIRDADLIDLSKPGIERFITLIRDTTEGLAALPEADQRYLDSHGFAVEVVGDGTHTGVVLKQMQLPQGKFNHPAADVLVILPPGYPDVAPDMFFCDPWLTLVSAGRYPTCADQPHAFMSRNWQRWSRHNTNWRPGVDGLHTMIKRIEHALAEAK